MTPDCHASCKDGRNLWNEKTTNATFRIIKKNVPGNVFPNYSKSCIFPSTFPFNKYLRFVMVTRGPARIGWGPDYGFQKSVGREGFLGACVVRIQRGKGFVSFRDIGFLTISIPIHTPIPMPLAGTSGLSVGKRSRALPWHPGNPRSQQNKISRGPKRS